MIIKVHPIEKDEVFCGLKGKKHYRKLTGKKVELLNATCWNWQIEIRKKLFPLSPESPLTFCFETRIYFLRWWQQDEGASVVEYKRKMGCVGWQQD